jgi:hypothetical protein
VHAARTHARTNERTHAHTQWVYTRIDCLSKQFNTCGLKFRMRRVLATHVAIDGTHCLLCNTTRTPSGVDMCCHRWLAMQYHSNTKWCGHVLPSMACAACCAIPLEHQVVWTCVAIDGTHCLLCNTTRTPSGVDMCCHRWHALLAMQYHSHTKWCGHAASLLNAAWPGGCEQECRILFTCVDVEEQTNKNKRTQDC